MRVTVGVGASSRFDTLSNRSYDRDSGGALVILRSARAFRALSVLKETSRLYDEGHSRLESGFKDWGQGLGTGLRAPGGVGFAYRSRLYLGHLSLKVISWSLIV